MSTSPCPSHFPGFIYLQNVWRCFSCHLQPCYRRSRGWIHNNMTYPAYPNHHGDHKPPYSIGPWTSKERICRSPWRSWCWCDKPGLAQSPRCPSGASAQRWDRTSLVEEMDRGTGSSWVSGTYPEGRENTNRIQDLGWSYFASMGRFQEHTLFRSSFFHARLMCSHVIETKDKVYVINTC